MALSLLKGVNGVEGDPKSKVLTVRYDPAEASLDRIKASLRESGYPGEEISP